ncbi:MAG: L-asparaginase 1, partial [Porphyromonadaceae bacterium]|nr:L-asparaginase 1 [Porphyromonadaceae bacterium]
RQAVARGLVIVNVTQCVTGYVDMLRYETGLLLQEIGLISGRDCTTESALTKMMYLFARGYTEAEVKRQMAIPLRGEMTLERTDEDLNRETFIYRR